VLLADCRHRNNQRSGFLQGEQSSWIDDNTGSLRLSDLRLSYNPHLRKSKFSSLIRLSDAEFLFSYTAVEQTFLAIAQWRRKTESRTVFCVYCMSERPVPVAARTKVWVCGRSLAVTAGLNPAGGMDVCLM
jgi:hypothetical protein